ncbi:MAG: hypothetical protein Q4D42_00200 [Eubacteriales bacterium]|nr:hypothetical protein [Eubacteriales bacterium]
MERWKRMVYRTVFPKLNILVACVLASAVLLGYTFLYGDAYGPIAYISYVLSAYALTIVCARLIRLPKNGFFAALHRNAYAHRYLTDIPFRTHVSLYLSLGLNLLFAAVKLVYGIAYCSVWFGTLAVYYILLAVMRFLLLRHVNRNRIGTAIVAEWKRYRLCGIILLLMNSALCGVVILMLHQKESFQYAGYLIYVVAMYAFYNMVTAVTDVVKYRKYNSPVLSASKAVKLAAALVSMLSLETAMLMQFNDREDAEAFRQMMTGATGISVCALVLAAAVWMIVRSTKQIRKLRRVPR